MSIFIHDCIECQQNKHINQEIQTATIQKYSEIASYFHYRMSTDTKGPINPPSKQCSKRCQFPITSLDYQICTSHIFSYRSWFRIH